MANFTHFPKSRNRRSYFDPALDAVYVGVCYQCGELCDLVKGCQCEKARALRNAVVISPPTLPADDLIWCEID